MNPAGDKKQNGQLGERLSATDIAGALIIAAALIIIDGRVLRAWRRPGRGLRFSRGTGGGSE